MKQANTTTRKLEELLHKKIITDDGKMLGHIFDIQLLHDGEHRVTALMYGQKSLLFRLHIYGPITRAFRLKHKPETIPWEAVKNFDAAAVHLKSDYR